MTALAHRRLAALTLVFAGAMSHAAPAATRPQLHYAQVEHRFHVDDARHPPDEPGLARDVEWAYPVFTDTHDPATATLNAWARASVKLLLGEVHGADSLTDAQVIARAQRDREFIDNAVDQAVVTPDLALGRLRGFRYNGEMQGGHHPIHTLSNHLYSLEARAEIQVADLFKADDEGVLTDLFDAQVHAPDTPCPDKAFDWASASLSAVDTLSFDYPYEPGHGRDWEDCSVVVIRSPKITRLLKSPRSLRPSWQLVADTPRR